MSPALITAACGLAGGVVGVLLVLAVLDRGIDRLFPAGRWTT